MPTEAPLSALLALRDERYAAFQRRLLPSLPPERIIGVRTPALRELAKRCARQPWIDDFLNQLPHRYFDEDQLHVFLLCQERDFAACVAGVERFLPYIDNWASCDQLSPPCFRRHRPELLGHIQGWLGSERTYTLRFGIGMLLSHFLDADFDPAYPEAVAAIRSEEYYVNMMIAWYFATALAKQYEAALPYLAEGRLDPWTHNKAIQKAIESRRICQERKDALRGLRR